MKCMARDSESAGIGCDNMTVVIVALLNGRSTEEWQAWVKERVDKKIGYDTPESVPDVFPNQPAAPSGGIGMGGYRIGGAGGGLANIASILSAQGITFRTPEEDSDEEGDLQMIGDEPDKIPQGSDVYMDDKGIKGKTAPKNVSDELVSWNNIRGVVLYTDKQEDSEADQEMDRPAKSGSVKLDDDGDSTMDSGDESDTTTTGDKAPTTSTPSKKISGSNQKGSPITPSFTSIGSPQVATHQELQRGASNPSGLRPSQEQLRKTPEGDEASAAVKVEGLMDTSEDPLKM
jgi:protein phosphatase 2C family protein 2/3